MKPSIIAAIVFVIGSGIAGSYFILKNSLSSASTNNVSLDAGENATAEASGKIPINWISKIGDTIADIASSSFSDVSSVGQETQANALPGANTSKNLTEAVAQTIFSRMKTQDQSGNQPFQAFNPNNPSDQALLSEATQSLDPTDVFLSNEFSVKDLKISSDNSVEAKIRYFHSIGTISVNYFKDEKYVRTADQIISDTNSDCFGGGSSINQDVSNIYKSIVSDYINLSVPVDLIDLHRELISYFKSSSEIYRSLANCSNDPVGGYLAAQVLPQLISENQDVQNKITKLYSPLVQK